MRSKPGTKAQLLWGLGHEKQQDTNTCDRHKEAGNDEALLGKLLGQPLGGEDETSSPTVAAVKMMPVRMAS